MKPEPDVVRGGAATLPRGRLAPSPTGRLHLGHARTFALAWAHARSRGGEVLLRLEDLDGTRCRAEYVDGVLRDLQWLGLDWDGPVSFQSQRLEALGVAAEQLLAAGAAYVCVCSRADLKNAASAPQRGVLEPRYPGTCRARQSGAGGRQRGALRFRVPEGCLRFTDGIAGAQSHDVASEIGDFVIANRHGVPAYQLAVVVDDAAQGINEVFRGDDLLSSTPRQIMVQRALGLASPAWFHAPLVLDERGRRLAKRADDLSLETLREEGVDPRAILSWVGQSAGFDVPDRVTSRELYTDFELARLRREPVLLSDELIERLREAR